MAQSPGGDSTGTKEAACEAVGGLDGVHVYSTKSGVFRRLPHKFMFVQHL